MGRLPKHDATALLDVAASLAFEGGPGAVTMSAVARASGAPSGSLYHRFPGRPSLLAALWLRTVNRFQEGFFVALDTDDHLSAAAAGARHVVAWSRKNPHEATILLYGPTDFAEHEWTLEDRERLAATNRHAAKAIKELMARLDRTTDKDQELVRLAVVDLPYSMVRRYLRGGKPLPKYAEELVAATARSMLTG